jgi:hypothetical protein
MAGVTRIGATKQYSDNWDNIFGGKRSSPKSTTAKSAKASAKRKPAKKKAKAAKKSRGRK